VVTLPGEAKPIVQTEPSRQVISLGPQVLCTFSAAWAWRPSVVVDVVRTLGRNHFLLSSRPLQMP
jgi:hypothetical protein